MNKVTGSMQPRNRQGHGAARSGAGLNFRRAGGIRVATSRRVWWMDPFKFLLFFVLPIFLLTTSLGGKAMEEFGSMNFLTYSTVGMGLGAILAMMYGIYAGFSLSSGRGGNVAREMDIGRLRIALNALMILTLLAHLFLFWTLFQNPAAIIGTLQAEKGAIYESKENLNSLLGVSSLVNLTPIVLSIAAVLKVKTGKGFSGFIKYTVPVFIIFIFMRAFLAAERMVFLEAAAGYFLPFISFRKHETRFVNIFPIAGLVGVLIIFAFGEYTRSWPYYMDSYNSFFEFASMRLLGYIGVASNTGAGVVTTADPIGFPYITASWARRLFDFDGGSSALVMQNYYMQYGNAEFNNPGGLYAGYIDFGMIFGLLYYLVCGVIIGWAYRRFLQQRLFGVLFYPLLYIGLMIIIQAIYWGGPKFATPFFVAALVSFWVERRGGAHKHQPGARLGHGIGGRGG